MHKCRDPSLLMKRTGELHGGGYTECFRMLTWDIKVPGFHYILSAAYIEREYYGELSSRRDSHFFSVLENVMGGRWPTR